MYHNAPRGRATGHEISVPHMCACPKYFRLDYGAFHGTSTKNRVKFTNLEGLIQVELCLTTCLV